MRLLVVCWFVCLFVCLIVFLSITFLLVLVVFYYKLLLLLLLFDVVFRIKRDSCGPYTLGKYLIFFSNRKSRCVPPL